MKNSLLALILIVFMNNSLNATIWIEGPDGSQSDIFGNDPYTYTVYWDPWEDVSGCEFDWFITNGIVVTDLQTQTGDWACFNCGSSVTVMWDNPQNGFVNFGSIDVSLANCNDNSNEGLIDRNLFVSNINHSIIIGIGPTDGNDPCDLANITGRSWINQIHNSNAGAFYEIDNYNMNCTYTWKIPHGWLVTYTATPEKVFITPQGGLKEGIVCVTTNCYGCLPVTNCKVVTTVLNVTNNHTDPVVALDKNLLTNIAVVFPGNGGIWINFDRSVRANKPVLLEAIIPELDKNKVMLQWYKVLNGEEDIPIHGANKWKYLAEENGEYRVKAKLKNAFVIDAETLERTTHSNDNYVVGSSRSVQIIDSNTLINNEENLLLDPNPASISVIARYNVAGANSAKLEIRDINNGQLKKSYILDLLTESLSKEMNVFDLRNGVYTVNLIENNQVKGSKLLKVHK